MTRSPALISSARAGAVVRRPTVRTAASAKLALEARSDFASCILLSPFLVTSFHEMGCGMQRAKHADDGEDQRRERDLGLGVARQVAKRVTRQGKPWRQPKAIHGSEAHHCAKQRDLEQQY